MKKLPIREHREKDLQELREILWVILRSEKATAKDKVEAGKLVARLHHAVTPEKGDAESGKKVDKPKLKPAHQTALDEIMKKSST